MRVVVVSLLTVLSVVVYTAARSEPAKPPADEKAVVKELAENLKAEDVKGLFEALRRLVPPEHAGNFGDPALEQFRKIREQGASVFGKRLGEVEVAYKQTIGQSYSRYVMVDRHQKGGMVWTFDLYRSPTGWLVANMGTQDKFQQFFISDQQKN